MSNNAYKGMDTYNRILQDARIEGKPIGPKHHLLDHHLKQWAKEAHARTKVLTETRTARAVEIKEKVKTLRSKPTLREKYEQEQRAKIAEGYKVKNSTDDLPSRGNGL